MKKYFLPVIISIGFALFSFTACDNFMKSDLIDSLDQKIEYENYQTFNIRVNVDSVNHGSVYCSKTTSLRKTDRVELEFTPAADYTFIRWNVTDAATKTKDYSNCLKIYAPERTITTLEVIDTNEDILKNGVLVRPVCVKTIGFTNKSSPAVSDTTSYPCDTSPDLYLTSNLSKNNDWDKIEIKLTNPIEDGKRYFEFKPMTADAMNNICYMAKTGEGERIEVSSASTRTVTISLPADFKYVVEETGEEKEFGKVISYTYNINYQTQDKTSIDIGITNDENPADKEMGTLRVEGQSGTSFRKSYNIGESFTVAFSLNPAYIFEGWECSNSSAVKILYPKDANGYNQYFDDEGNPSYYDSVTNMYYATVTVINSDANVKVTAKAKQIPHRDIKFYSSEGKISPNATVDKKVGDKVPLTFTSDPDFCFTYWAVKVGNDTLSKEEGLKYFKFDNIEEPDTTVTFAKDIDSDELISIVPVCVLRPKVLYNIPSYDSMGAFRDSRVQILFDHDMAEDSIYYTEAELVALEKKYSISRRNNSKIWSDAKTVGEKYLLYKDTVSEEKQYYGYSDGTYEYYKNISISDISTGYSLLDKFAEPEFENPRLLVITTAGGTKAPSALTQLVVELSKDVYFVTTENYAVPMASNLKWSYCVNDQMDNMGPAMQSVLTGGRLAGVTDQISREISIPADKTSSMIAYINNDELTATVSISDDKSLPSLGVSLNLRRVKDEYYDDVYYADDKTGWLTLGTENNEKLVKTATTVASGTVKFKIPEDYEDGIYQVYLTTKDNNGNQTHSFWYKDDNTLESQETDRTHYYYILISRNGPAFKDGTFRAITPKDTDGKISLEWDNPKVPYFEKINKIISSTYTKNIESDSVTNLDVTGLNTATTYTFTVEAEDIFGHKATKEVTKNTLPNAPDWAIAKKLGTDGKSVAIQWQRPEFVSASKGLKGVRVYYSTDKNNYSSDKYIDGSDTTLTIPNLDFAHTYYFKIYTIDEENNLSLNYCQKDNQGNTISDYSFTYNTAPNVIREASQVENTLDLTNKTIKLNFTKPDNNAELKGWDSISVKYKAKDGTEFVDAQIIDINYSLQNGTAVLKCPDIHYGDYDVQIYTVDGYGNKSIDFHPASLKIVPNAVTGLGIVGERWSYGDGMPGVRFLMNWNELPPQYEGMYIEYWEGTDGEVAGQTITNYNGIKMTDSFKLNGRKSYSLESSSNLMWIGYNVKYKFIVYAYGIYNGNQYLGNPVILEVRTPPQSPEIQSTGFHMDQKMSYYDSRYNDYNYDVTREIKDKLYSDNIAVAKWKTIGKKWISKYLIEFVDCTTSSAGSVIKSIDFEEGKGYTDEMGNSFIINSEDSWNNYCFLNPQKSTPSVLYNKKIKLRIYAVNSDGGKSLPMESSPFIVLPPLPKNVWMYTDDTQRTAYLKSDDANVSYYSSIRIYHSASAEGVFTTSQYLNLDLTNNLLSSSEKANNIICKWDNNTLNSYMNVVPCTKINNILYECTSMTNRNNSNITDSRCQDNLLFYKEPLADFEVEGSFNVYDYDVEDERSDYYDRTLKRYFRGLYKGPVMVINTGYYYFKPDSSGKWTSNNKGKGSTEASTTWYIYVPSGKTYTFKYKVSSESGYDKFTIKKGSDSIVNEISGNGSEKEYTLGSGPHSITATYSKDNTQDVNDDCGYVIFPEIY